MFPNLRFFFLENIRNVWNVFYGFLLELYLLETTNHE